MERLWASFRCAKANENPAPVGLFLSGNPRRGIVYYGDMWAKTVEDRFLDFTLGGQLHRGES
jgi:hypothetical protein